MKTEEKDSTLAHKRCSRSVRPETAAETTKVHKHWSRARTQKSEQRSQEDDEGSKKKEWIKEQCKHLEKGMMSGNNKEAHNTLKALTNTQQHKSAVIEDRSRDIVTEGTAVLNRWTEYCIGLHSYELHPDTSLLHPE